MDTPHPCASSLSTTPGPLRHHFLDAARYWEPRRLAYNVALSAVAGTWILATWPHFRPALVWGSLPPILVLALLANLCYCAAYLVDVPLQSSPLAALWGRSRWLLWLLGTLFAIVLESYWIADEIFPDFH